MFDAETAEQLKAVMSKGAVRWAIMFTTDDCESDYDDLKSRGVEFMQEPTEPAVRHRRRVPRQLRHAFRLMQLQ